MASETYSLIGADVSEVSSAKTFAVGQRVTGDDGATYEYVEFAAVISGASRWVGIDETRGLAAYLTTTNLADGWTVGVTTHSGNATSGQSGWVQINGVAQAYVASGVTADSLITASGTSGIAGAAASAGATCILGAVNAAAGASANAAVEVILNYPHWNGV